MTASERFAAYLAGESVDRLPIMEWAPWWTETIDRWRGEGLPEDRRTVEEIQDYFGLDKCLQTGVSVTTEATPTPPGFGLGVMEDEKDYLEKILPTLFPDPEKAVSDERLGWLRSTRERGDTVHFFTLPGFFWYPRTLFGIENHLLAFYDCPELMQRMNEDYCRWAEKVMHAVFSRFRFDFMTFAEDMSYNGGPMIGKSCFDTFLAPFYRRLIPIAHAYGVPVIIDSDGDITAAVDWYRSVGADGMLPLERKAGVDVSVYLDRHPDMTFIGHFDKMCMKHGEAAMRREFERLMPSMLRGKLIPSVDHQTPPDVSMETYRLYLSLFREYAAKVTHAGLSLPPCPVTEARHSL